MSGPGDIRLEAAPDPSEGSDHAAEDTEERGGPPPPRHDAAASSATTAASSADGADGDDGDLESARAGWSGSRFDEDRVAQELRSTEPVWLVRQVVRCPLLAMVLFIALPVAAGAWALAMGTTVDTSLDSFEIQNHPLAEIKDGLEHLISVNSQYWEQLQQGLDGRRLLQGPVKAGEEGSPARLNAHGDWRVNIVYALQPEAQATGESILQEDILRHIQSLESAIKALPAYSSFCLHKSQEDRACSPPVSVLNFLFPTKTTNLETGQAVAEFDGNGEEMVGVDTALLALVKQGLYWYTDANADLMSGNASFLRTDFLFGRPADGYASELDDLEGQKAEYQALAQQIADLLIAASTEKVKVFYGGGALTNMEVNQVLVDDVTLALFGLAAVGILLALHTRSLFITAAGLIEIVVSIPAAYFIFRVPVGLEETGILQFLSIFVIIGIGVDDVFVFYGHFRASLPFAADGATLTTRLSHAYRRAGAAMLVTSVTSATAFAANVISPVPAVRLFGATIAAMVVINYALVITWLPACVAFWDLYILRTDRRAFLQSGADGPQHAQGRGGGCNPKWTAPHGLRSLSVSWAGFGRGIFRLRWALLVVAAVLTAIGCLAAVGLEGSQTVPQLFPSDSNLQMFVDAYNSEFLSTGGCGGCLSTFSADAASLGLSGGASPAVTVQTDSGDDSPPPPLLAPTLRSLVKAQPNKPDSPWALDPLCPDSIAANATSPTTVTVSWSEPEGLTAVSFRLVATGGLGEPCGALGASVFSSVVVAATASGPPAKVRGLLPGASYLFSLEAVGEGGGASGCGTSECVTLPSVPPGVPLEVTASVVDGPAGDSALLVSWREPETGWEAADSPEVFEVETVRGEGAVTDGAVDDWSGLDGYLSTALPAGSTEARFGGLSPGVTYGGRVRAINSAGAGPWSSPVTALVPELLQPPVPRPMVVPMTLRHATVFLETNFWEPQPPDLRFLVEVRRVPSASEGYAEMVAGDGEACADGEQAEPWSVVCSGSASACDWQVPEDAQHGDAFRFRSSSSSKAGTSAFGCHGPHAVLVVDYQQPVVDAPVRTEVVEVGSTFAVVSFRPPSVPYPISTFRVRLGFRGREDAVTLEAPANATRACIGGLSPGATFSVRVMGWNEMGPGPESEELHFRTAPAPAGAAGGLPRQLERADLDLPAAGLGPSSSQSSPGGRRSDVSVSASVMWPTQLWYTARGDSPSQAEGVPLVVYLTSTPAGALDAFAPVVGAAPEAPEGLAVSMVAEAGGSLSGAVATETSELVHASVVTSLTGSSATPGPAASLVLDVSPLLAEGYNSDDMAEWLLGTLAALADRIGPGEGGGVAAPTFGPLRRSRAIAGVGEAAGVAARLVFEHPETARALLLIGDPDSDAMSSGGIIAPHDQIQRNGTDLFVMAVGGRRPAAAVESAAALVGCQYIEPDDREALVSSVGMCVVAVLDDDDDDDGEGDGSAAMRGGLPPSEAWARALMWTFGVLGLPTLSELQVEPGPNTSNEVVHIVWGIAGVESTSDAEGLFSTSTGAAVMDSSVRLSSEAAQLWVLNVCDSLRSLNDLVEEETSCVMRHLKWWGETQMGHWPIPEQNFATAVRELLSRYEYMRSDIGWADPDSDDEVAWVRISMRSKASRVAAAVEAAVVFQQWDTVIEDLERDAPPEARNARHTCSLWVRMATEVEIVQGLRMAVAIAGLSALAAILIFTGDPWMAALATLNLSAIVATLLGSFRLLGWDIGSIEAISVTVLVGLSCDFCLHLAETYSHSSLPTRRGRAVEAVQRTGSPITAAAVTTTAAVLPVLWCTIQVMKKFGIIIAINMVVSLFYGFFFFVPLLMVCGPMPLDRFKQRFRVIESMRHALWGSILRRTGIVSGLLVLVCLCLPQAPELRGIASALAVILAFCLLAEMAPWCLRRLRRASASS